MGSRLQRVLWAPGCVLAGAVAAAGFFVNAFFPQWAALRLDSGLALLVMPLLCGFLLGALLAESDLAHVAVAGLAMTFLVLGFVGLFLWAPSLSGLPAVIEGVSLVTVRQVGLSAILLFPFIITGCVLGHGFASSFLPPEHVKDELRQLREDTRRWHEELEELERRIPPRG